MLGVLQAAPTLARPILARPVPSTGWDISGSGCARSEEVEVEVNETFRHTITASLKVRIPSVDLTESREKLQIQNETPNVAS